MTAPRTKRNDRIMRLLGQKKPVYLKSLEKTVRRPLSWQDIADQLARDGFGRVTRQAVGKVVVRERARKAVAG